MASPSSSASSVSSTRSSKSSIPNRQPGLQDLVNHFVVSKRSLATQTVLWRANQVVTTARELLEEKAILAARNTSLANVVEEQVDSLVAVRRGIDVVEAEVQAEFKHLLHHVDSAYAGLQSTLAVLRDTPIEAVLQPPDTPQKHLFDFIDSTAVTSLKDSLRACIDRFNDARTALNDSNDSFDTSLDNLHSSIRNVPSSPQTAPNSSPLPGLYSDLETHAKEAAQAFQSLVRHYDLCVTALKHTEGGSAAATQATGDAPVASGVDDDDLSAPPEPITDEERQEMLGVLHKDAQEVEDVVSEIRERGTDMEGLLNHMTDHIQALRNEDAAWTSILRLLADLAVQARHHIDMARSFHASWLQDTQPTLVSGIDEWDKQRDFYERFDLAYAELLVEISARRRRHDKAKRRADEAQRDLDRLFAEDERSREQFTLAQGDFLPLDIWPGLGDAPRRYRVQAVGLEREPEQRQKQQQEGGDGAADEDEDEEEGGDGVVGQSIPQLGRNVVERALARVKRRM